ncbi:MAG: peptidoglycan DD-metalloendopeptidase family protein [Pseudomonadota bacterium]|nr:peptidoglycan DD-metalloendopeptidase family protein [Pseudomonadota bacterium]
MKRFVITALATAALSAGFATAQGRRDEASALLLAQRQADEATRRSQQLEREAAQATNEAAQARAAAAAVAARIEAAEADLTAAETRIRIVEALRARQRARLAERQEPVVRLTAALQTMARRPPALALVQPGSVDELVHVRSLLASTLPVIRARTAGLREEVRAGNTLRRQAEVARAALIAGQEELRRQRIAFARLEAEQRRRSLSLASSALSESDRALALGEEARDLTALMSTRQYQARLRASLAKLPGPLPRPGSEREPSVAARQDARYMLPVEGRLVTGMGEISDAGVHARGLTFEPATNAPVLAPRGGKVVYAGPFRGYGQIVIIDHGGGWTSVVTGLSVLSARLGQTVAMGAPLGRAAAGERGVTVELRRNGRPIPIAPLLG